MALAAGQPARYRLLGTIRAYAASRAHAVAAQVRRAHARYCCELAEAEVRARYQPAPADPPPPPFDEANYLAALTWAAASEPALADRLLRCLAQLIEMQPSRRGIEVISAVATATRTSWPTSTWSARCTSGCRAGWRARGSSSTAR